VWRDGQSVAIRRSRERALLTLLGLHANQTVSTDRLAEDLWGAEVPEGAAKAVRVYVSRLRQALGDPGDLLVTRPAGYLLQVAPDAIDATRFAALVATGRAQAARGDHEAAADTFREALGLWRGPALADIADLASAQAAAAQLEETRQAALEERLEADLACGRHHAVAAELDALVRQHPLRERLWGQRMTALYRAGRQADALRAYQELRRTLGEELGIEPSSGLRCLETAILRHDPELDWPPPAPPVGTPAVAAETAGSAAAGGVVTFLFTDVVGSTELLAQLGDDLAEENQQAHFKLLRSIVAAHGGTEVKSLGDGLMVVFTSPLEALRCAVAMQRGLADGSGRQPAMRIGLHAGEPIRHEDDFFGTPVVVAKRLCDQAEGGQILASALVRDLLGQRREGTVAFRALGPLVLKGLPDPVAACQVLWQTTDEGGEPPPGVAGPFPVPLPLPLQREERFALVSRADELSTLEAAWAAARSGQRRLVLLAGEPGIGKTRLTTEFARQLQAGGATVLFGRCDEGMGVPYQPFVEALGRYTRDAPTASFGRLAGELTRLVPEVAERIPGLPPPLRSDPESERYRLFDAVVAWLSAASNAVPVLLALDDLHWATKPTLLLLRHLVRSDEALSLLVLAAYRDTHLDLSSDLADALAELLRQPGVDRVRLSGVDEAGVTTMVQTQAGPQDPEEARALARALHAQTAGNPFFVGEMLGHLAEKGLLDRFDRHRTASATAPEVEIPDSVRDVVGRRLTRLPDDSTETLAFAAVLGERFELAVLAEAAEMPEAATGRRLNPAVAARLVEETGVGTYRFAHALVRATLEEALGPTRRAQLHRAAGLAIETVHAGGLDDHLAALARHWARAATTAAETARAVDYTWRAGDRALAQLAHDEAAEYYRQALELLGSVESTAGDGRQLDLLISLGEAERRAGDPRHRQTLLDAAALAAARGDPDALARAALANQRGSLWSVAGAVDLERVAVLEAALDAVDDQDSPVRARLLANLALELIWAGDQQRRVRLSDEALAMARRVGDAATLGEVLGNRAYVIAAPSTLHERLANAVELLALSERLGDSTMASRAWSLRFRASIEAGDTAEADRCLEECERLAGELNQPGLRWVAGMHRTGRVLLAGDVATAERLARETFELGRAAGQLDAAMLFSYQRARIRYEQGRTDEVTKEVVDLIEAWPRLVVLWPLLALTWTELDDNDRAREAYEHVAHNRFAALPVDPTWLQAVTDCAAVCARLGDVAGAGTLRELLAPYSDQLPVAALGVATGSVAHYLGLLAATCGDCDEAQSWFAAADATHARVGAPTWRARTRLESARMLLRRRGLDDADRARNLLGQALATARDLGLGGVERQALALLEECP
jgi:DNA-binding SARP family transcriptional activator/class 3 adenylate cyclase